MIDDGEGASKGRLASSRSFWKEHDRGYGFAQGGAPGAAPPRAFRQPSRIGLRVVVDALRFSRIFESFRFFG